MKDSIIVLAIALAVLTVCWLISPMFAIGVIIGGICAGAVYALCRGL